MCHIEQKQAICVYFRYNIGSHLELSNIRYTDPFYHNHFTSEPQNHIRSLKNKGLMANIGQYMYYSKDFGDHCGGHLEYLELPKHNLGQSN